MSPHQNVKTPRLPGVTRPTHMQSPIGAAQNVARKPACYRKRARNAMLVVALGGLVFGWVLDPGWYTFVAIGGWLAFVFSLDEPVVHSCSDHEVGFSTTYAENTGVISYYDSHNRAYFQSEVGISNGLHIGDKY